MILKSNFHFHTKDDPDDRLSYSFESGIDKAASTGFGVIALTLHNKFGYTEEYAAYAKAKGVLLLPGIELSIKKKHVVILNCDKDIEKIKSFEELLKYKKKNPEIFILAPHPYYGHGISLGRLLEKNINIFDGIEFSWFYSPINFNPNELARKIAGRYQLPFIATSDTHFLEYLETSWCELEAEELTIKSVLNSVRENKFKNVSFPRTVLEILRAYVKYFFI